ncbi:hypothetical protein AVEN_269966-1 [Araneus ventricosus]|uniref:Uncharacterized protein n=1 Tax=Araneus ventricosus TaxID=182803 RepID=A0A4Y2SFK7_ARAVE|nr:hypothetical protein AVEN_269966-1 [Araneus ventricosus]
METYLDRDGNLLPKFYQDPKWKVMKSILLTVFDCTCCIATWGLSIYLVFLKSIFIISYSLVFSCEAIVDRSKENKEEANIGRDSAEARRISGERPLQLPSSDEHLQKSRSSTPDSKARPVDSKSEESTRATTPEMERSLEDEKVRQTSEVTPEASSRATNEPQDSEESP